MNFTCPVCYYTGLQEPPTNYNICQCCGTEFGLDDEVRSHDELRTAWVNAGARWFFGAPPLGWIAWTQLFHANVGLIPYRVETTLYGGYGSSTLIVSAPFSPPKEFDRDEQLALAS